MISTPALAALMALPSVSALFAILFALLRTPTENLVPTDPERLPLLPTDEAPARPASTCSKPETIYEDASEGAIDPDATLVNRSSLNSLGEGPAHVRAGSGPWRRGFFAVQDAQHQAERLAFRREQMRRAREASKDSGCSCPGEECRGHDYTGAAE